MEPLARTSTWCCLAGPRTSFGDHAMPHLRGLENSDFKPAIEGIIAKFVEDTGPVTQTGDVAEAVWQAPTDPHAQLGIAAGGEEEASA